MIVETLHRDQLHRDLVRVQWISFVLLLLILSAEHWAHLQFAGDTIIPGLLFIIIMGARLILLLRDIRAGTLDNTGRDGVARTISRQRTPFIFWIVSVLYLVLMLCAIFLTLYVLSTPDTATTGNTQTLTALPSTIC